MVDKTKALVMNIKNIQNRVFLVDKLIKKEINQKYAAECLNITTRQIRRLIKNYKSNGIDGLISKRPGNSGRKPYNMEFRNTVINIIAENYLDFGPTLANEKLKELHGITISAETVRKWMIYAGIWVNKKPKPIRIHQPRARRDCFGELIQIDGSTHDWFEGRAPKCTLLVYIDDATSKLVELIFVNSESTESYFKATKNHLLNYGKPVAYYSDKHSVFRVNAADAKSGTGETQFSKALSKLGINIIFANSPEAKGRVERANKTLQDRLVKELRLRKISSISDANEFLKEYIVTYNNKFAKVPKSGNDFHTKLTLEEKVNLNSILAKHYIKKVSKNNTIQHGNITYILDEKFKYRLNKKEVLLIEKSSTEANIYYKNTEIKFITMNKEINQSKAVNRTEVNILIDKFIKSKSAKNEVCGQSIRTCGGT